MRIGIVVDGRAEFRSLGHVLVRVRTGHTILDPLYADIQPSAPPGRNAGAVESRLRLLGARRVDLAVVLVDREDQTECPQAIAEGLLAALHPFCARHAIPNSAVVVKDSKYENWLVADIETLQGMPKRFRITRAHARSVAPNRADAADGMRLLSSAAIGKPYSKVEDAARIMRRADPLSIARNSRSFRRFLRVLGHDLYRTQSRQPRAG